MSRICVKNLPKHVAEDRLRDFFSRKGEVTDAKLIRTKDGISRQFGFVGFRTEKEAQEALKFFNNSFMDTCKITCEIARKVGDPDMPRPWSRHSLKKQQNSPEEKKQVKGPKGSHLANSEEEKNKVKGTKSSRYVNSQEEDKDSENDDPQLQEFLEVMQPRANAKLWANDTSTVTPFEKTEKAIGKKVKVKGERKKENAVSKLDETVSGSVDGEAEKSYTSDHNEVVSDKDYFRSRVKTEWSDSENDDDDDGDDNDDDDDTKNAEDKVNLDSFHKSINNPNKQHAGNDIHKGNVFEGAGEEDENDMMKESNPKEEEEDEEEVFESGRLFVRNLPYTATEEELAEHFSRFGNVSQVHVAVDKYTKQSKGFGFVLYTLPESAARALENLDNSTFQGRLMHVMPAKVKITPLKLETNILPDQSMTFKKKRQEERKASEASGNTRAWNTLYLRPDTVVENIARKFGVSKSELLDRESDDIAVRIALGETQVIAETKKALENAGINVALLEEFAAGKVDNGKRSNHVIIVKNLPYASSEGELADLFGKYGNLDKIILPPTKALALVVFLEPVDAVSAFKRLAYARYKDAPLYLEWAPADIISHNSVSLTTANDSVIVGEHDSKKVYLEQQTEGMLDADIDTDRVESRSLYVKNLNFKTSDESLKKHFDKHVKEGKILSVRVKKHLKNGKNVSMGFGFIEFDSVDTAKNVCRDLQGTVLDQHALALQLCYARNNETVLKKAQKDQSSTKLIVRNVAFEATKKELKQLFSPFGQIKRLKLPMRYGHHRGFAFVEYVTKQEAQNALKALSSTHLYGRHLVLERAKEGESLDELRARIASQFEHEQNGFQKLSKKRKHMDVLDDGSLKFQKIVD